MYLTTLRKVGGSIMLAIPPAILELLQMQPGSSVSLAIKDGNLVMKPKAVKKYSLQELLAQCDPNAPLSEEDQEWTSSKPVGRELI